MEDFIEDLAQSGTAWAAIGSALKKVQYMRQNGLELLRIFEETGKQANKLEKLNIPDEKGLEDLKKQQDELQKAAKQILESVPQLETCICNLINDRDPLNLLVKKLAEKRERIDFFKFPPEFCSALERLHKLVNAFSAEYWIFTSHLKNIEKLTLKMITSIAQKKEQIGDRFESGSSDELALKMANSIAQKKEQIGKRIENRQAGAGAVAAALRYADIIALGFFTGGAAIALGVIRGVCYISDALTIGLSKLKLLPGLASSIEETGKSLEVIAKELKEIGNDATAFKMDEKAIEALEQALKLFMKMREEEEKRREEKALMEEELAREKTARKEKEEELARERAEKKEKEEELARERAKAKELESKLRALGHV